MKIINLLLLLLCCLANISFGQNQVTLQQFSAGYASPLDVENCGDSRLFIVQQAGSIIVCDSSGKKINIPYLDITDRVLYNGGELGLLGAIFDPNYASNGYVYVQYINKDSNIQISRFKRSANNANKANAGSEKLIIEISKPPFVSHNGGCIRFGPDGYLYIGLGDGGGAGDPYNLSQNKTSLLGKMLRIDVHNGNPYSIPPNNPFIDSSNYRKEIWALGLRNPWRWSFDALTGALIIGDVGQDSWEEIDFQSPGKGGQNYGWRCYEGKHVYNDSGCNAQSFYTMPVYEYPHADATNDCSVTGGFVYRGTKYKSWYGKYFFGDYCSGVIKTLTPQAKKITEQDVFNGDDYAYVSFGEDYKHELYVVELTTGVIYKIIPATTNKMIVQVSISSLHVSPNPSHGNMVVSFKSGKAQSITITIQNYLGQVFYKDAKLISAGNNILNIINSLPVGNYHLIVQDANGYLLNDHVQVE